MTDSAYWEALSLSRTVSLLTAAMVFWGCLACKEQSHTSDRSASVEKTSPKGEGANSRGFYAADPVYLQKNNEFFFQIYGVPFVSKLGELPTTGEVPDEAKPYSGYWYPEKKDGTNAVISGTLSPLQKYDAAFHSGENKAAKWEGDFHNNTTDSWAGHCNGMAAAAARHPQQPTRNVTKNGVTFSPLDIKALLAEAYMSADFEFLAGKRCYETAANTNPLARPKVDEMSDCEDTNPGTFHAVIANWIGRKQQALIMDEKSNNEVWNFPFYKYEVVTLQKGITADQAREYVTGGTGTYVFNPNAKTFAYVKMRLYYANALGAEEINERKAVTLVLTYVLEMNAADEIVGGEWVGANQQNHPDFIWVALPPLSPDGTRDTGNAELASDQVIRLWAESAGLDPAKLPATIARPAFLGEWGKFPNFAATLDGSQRGAVFAGKSTFLEVTRQPPLADASLTILLNAVTLTTLPGTGAGPIKYELSPGPGLNRLQLIWKKNDLVIDSSSLRFHVTK